MAAEAKAKTYNEKFAEIATVHHDRIAVRVKTPAGYRQVNYGELHGEVLAVASALLSQGLKPQERAAILSENRPEWVVAYLGIHFAGGIAVPLDPQISPEEWRRLLDDSETQVIFVSGLLLARLKRAVHDSPLRNRVICFDPVSVGESACSLAGLIETGNKLAPTTSLPASDLSDVAVIIYTSGTTGRPKGVMLTQENIMEEISAVLQVIHVGENDAFLCLLPLQHILPSVMNFLLPLYLGAQVVFADTLRRSEILAALQEAGITILATVPQFFYLLHGRIQEGLEHKGPMARRLFRVMLSLNRFCLGSLHINAGKLLFGRIHRTFGSSMRLFASGGSAFDPKVAREFHDFGFTILQGYGLTETTGAATVTPVERNVIGSVGLALPGVELSILEPGQNGIGEVAIRGPIVMKGYYKNPEATAEVMRDGWFLSGDLGWLDSGGNLYITGRKKEVIVLPNGKNIYPDELETHYEQCLFIQEIAVLGIAEPGHEGAERLHGVVVPDFNALKARKIANAREILRDEIARLSHQLPQYKRLMSYQIQSEPLPRTTTRKIKRLELKRMIESGELKGVDAAGTSAVSDEDQGWIESVVGQQVMNALRESFRKDTPISLDMNLELDLGFDSMERVELLASLEHSLRLELPDSFAAEVFTVRDLIRALETQTGEDAGTGGPSKQNWGTLLSAEALNQEEDLQLHFAGSILTLFKYAVIRLLYWTLKILFRMEAKGLENLPPEGPFLICPNHLSYIDAIIVMGPLPYRIVRSLFFVGAADLFDKPWMRLLARVANIYPVDPDTHLLRAMKMGAFGLRDGGVLCIFPEGVRSFDGKLGPFKKGAAILAREIGVSMVPVAIRGAHEVWARGSRRIHLRKLAVEFGVPLRAGTDVGGTSYEADTDRLKQAVSRMLDAS